MTLVRLRALRQHWRKHPRIEWLAAAYFKYKPPVEDTYPAPMRSAMAELAARHAKQQEGNIAEFFGLKPGMKITG